MADKDKGVVDFGSMDAEYATRVAAAKSAKVPLGGAPMPKIPPLDQAPPDPATVVKVRRAAEKMLTPEQMQQLRDSGSFLPGVGSGYAVNQPGLRDGAAATPPTAGEYANPPRPKGAGLRPETAQQIQEVMEANTKSDVDEDLDKVAKEVNEIDDQYELNEFGERVRTLLVNKPRRLAIEGRSKPMQVEDLFLGELTQRVPIIPSKFEPTFRPASGEENLFIKRMMSNERGSPQYLADKFALLNLVLGLFAINNTILPSHLDKDGLPDEKLFEAKFKYIRKMPYDVLVDLSVNFDWFTKRVQRLLVVDDIKGF